MPRFPPPSVPCPAALLTSICCGVLLALTGKIDPAVATPAAQLYQQKCASCHGAGGSGVKDHYEGPLHGEETVAELAERIADTMPEDDPAACVGAEAHEVAEYIYQEFYSPAARREKGLLVAPRVELARLTVPQYRSAITDLIATFTPPPGDPQADPSQPGLHAQYFQSKGMSKTDQLQLERIDPGIDFDFASEGPTEDIASDQFAIIWQGNVLVRDTGDYLFRIQTANGARLFVNADGFSRSGKLRDDSSEFIQSRLIDGWVSSGKMRELTGRIFLLGGRRYPIRVEFFKYQEPTASIRLEWKPPHGVWAPVDEQVLSSAPVARTFVIDTPLPADDRSMGYERGSSVSQEWHNGVANGALATAHEVIGRLPLLSGAKNTEKNRHKLADFVVRFASTAFRRPLTAAEKTLFHDTLFQDATRETAVRRAVLLSLTSPHFLYTDLTPGGAEPTPHTVASRLAFALWDSLPDAELRRLADEDRLTTTAQIESQADRMLDDPRTRMKLQGFFRHWLELEDRDLVKDQQLYPEFDEGVIADLRQSLELFLEQVVWSRSSDYRELLQANHLLLNRRLQHLYAPAHEPASDQSDPAALAAEGEPAGNPFVRVDTSSEGRSGVLTHPYLLSAFSYHNTTSPIHRGVFLTRNIMGRRLKPPPVAVAFENSDFAPDMTMRQKVTELTRDQACLSCHNVINPLGFALENFDAVGRWRTLENDLPIDTHSNYLSTAGATLPISSARDIANFAVTSPVAQRAFVTQLFQHLVRQSPQAYGPETLGELQQAFVADDFHIKKLLVRIATHAAMRGYAPPQN